MGVLGDLGQIAGAYMGAKASKKATKAQAKSAQAALDLQKQMFDTTNQLQAPFREAGVNATNRLQEYMGLGGNTTSPNYGKYTGDFSMSDFQQDPGYAFRISEGLKALDRQAAARGGLISGGALKATERYGQDMASQEYQNAFNRYQVNRANQLNPLQSLAGAGQTATNALSNAASGYANAGADLLTQQGNAKASGYIGQANSLNNAISNITNAYQQQNMLNTIFGKAGGGGSTGGYSDSGWYDAGIGAKVPVFM